MRYPWRCPARCPASFATLLLAACLLAACSDTIVRVPPPQASPAGLLAARQLVLVITPAWDAPSGGMRAFSRPGPDAPWREDIPETAVGVGRSGLGWGRGLHGEPRTDGPAKREGDGRAPAGAFLLPLAYAAPGAPGSPSFTVLPSSADLLCVDDAASTHYNRIVDKTAAVQDWNSSEDMLRPDGLYRQVVLVDHNVSPATPGGGSCIFLHIRRGPDSPTAGCTAMDATALEALVAWLDSSAAPVLVQLPMMEYQRLRDAWRLP